MVKIIKLNINGEVNDINISLKKKEKFNLNLIKTQLDIKNDDFKFNLINFEIDRYIIDSTKGKSNEQYIVFANYDFNI